MIKDKVVIITGASSGIGGATARLLANQRQGRPGAATRGQAENVWGFNEHRAGE